MNHVAAGGSVSTRDTPAGASRGTPARKGGPGAGKAGTSGQVATPRPVGGTAAAPDDDPFGSMLAPLTQRTTGERIADRFVTAIALGEFIPGQQLPSERELAVTLDVSRTTVREALQILQAAGYVTTRRGRGGGTFVRTAQGADSDGMIRRALLPVWDALGEVLDFRQLVEQQIARTAAERRDNHDINAIRKAIVAYEGAQDRDESRLADMAVHLAIAQAAHNSRLIELSARIRREVSFGFDAQPYSAELRRRAMRQHPALADAVICGDPTAAADMAAQHFSLTEHLLKDLHARISLRSDVLRGPPAPQAGQPPR
jgi:GntR family transcriptional regulator, transcriptional repressor for pyruvate dehydrogenase complex